LLETAWNRRDNTFFSLYFCKKYFMKQVIYFSAALLLFVFASQNSSAQAFENGDNVLSVGLGVGSGYHGINYSSSPAISIQYEHGNWDVGGPGVISLGGFLGYKGFRHEEFGYVEKWNYTVIGLRSAYHYNGIDAKELDVYGGLMLSYDILSYSNNFPASYNYGGYTSGLGISVYIGGRYYFTDNVGAFLELGYGISYATLGVAFKL
jgi:hypothetical protein